MRCQPDAEHHGQSPAGVIAVGAVRVTVGLDGAQLSFDMASPRACSHMDGVESHADSDPPRP